MGALGSAGVKNPRGEDSLPQRSPSSPSEEAGALLTAAVVPSELWRAMEGSEGF